MDGERRSPSGIVAFLFTDIVGSSALWEAHDAAMASAVEHHDRLMRDAIDRHGGVVFATAGDAFSVAFDTVDQALGAALEAQRALSGGTWPSGVQIGVRMGVHAGAAWERDGNYYGTALNRAARLMGLAVGGEILVSHAVEELLRDKPSAEVALEDLGPRPLRGLSSPQRVFRVKAHGLREVVGSPRTFATEGNLPIPSTSFVGRVDDLTRLGACVHEHRFVTVVGPGGMGKTRLAVEAARAIASGSDDGVFFVDLAPVDSDAVVVTAADALGITLRGETSQAQQLVSAVADRSMLLVIDNCEHVLSSVATLVHELLRSAPRCRVLCTSRAALGVAGEQLFPLGGLADEATGLFLERVHGLLPGYVPDGADTAAISEICARLDGSPLAIELAAARVRSLRPTDIASRLDERFRLLRGGARDVTKRHQTLHATIQWSYDLLEPREQVLYQRLSVFAGGFTLEAAEQVAADGELIAEPDVLDLIDGLVDKSIIGRASSQESTRYAMLETLRAFGVEQLNASGAASHFALAHAAYFRALCLAEERRLLSTDETRAWERITEDWDNIRRAFETAEAAGRADIIADVPAALGLYAVLAMQVEVGAWARLACRSGPLTRQPSELDVRGAWGLSAFLVHGDLAQRHEAVNRAVIDPADQGRGTSQLAGALHAMNLSDVATHDEITSAWVNAAPPGSVSQLLALSQRAIQGAWFDDPSVDAAAHAAHAVRLGRDLGSPSLLAWALWYQGLVAERSDPRQALGLFQDAQRLLEPIGRPHFLRLALGAWVFVAAAQGDDLAEALRTARDVLRDSANQGVVSIVVQTLRVAALTVCQAGCPEQAARMLGAADATGMRSPATMQLRSKALAAIRGALGDDADALLDEGATSSPLEAGAAAIATIDAILGRLVDGPSPPPR